MKPCKIWINEYFFVLDHENCIINVRTENTTMRVMGTSLKISNLHQEASLHLIIVVRLECVGSSQIGLVILVNFTLVGCFILFGFCLCLVSHLL